MKKIMPLLFLVLVVSIALTGFSATPESMKLSVFEIEPSEVLFKGGEFSLAVADIEAITTVAPDGVFTYFLFEDGLLIRTYKTAIGMTYPDQIGVWSFEQTQVRCFFKF